MTFKVALICLTLCFLPRVYSQQFITKAVIEYEVKSNIKKTMGNNMFTEMLKENLPQFKTGYYTFTFADNQSIYKFDHWDLKARIPEYLRKSDEENVWYFDHNTGKFNMQKNVWGSNLNIEDSIPNLLWKFTNENRVIAGFNCRKAVTKIFDSVYVFAFYTDEILIPGGPCSINGLPGLILGLTIPRLFTSWIATSIKVNSVDKSLIKPVSVKKNFSLLSLKATLDERTKDWYSGGDDANELVQQKNRFRWGILL